MARCRTASCTSRGLLGTEAVDRGALVGLAGAQDRGREVGVVGGVGEVLGLEGEGVALAVGLLADAQESAVEEVAAVELDAGLVGVYFDGAAVLGLPEPSSEPHAMAVGLSAEDEVVVVAAAEDELLVVTTQSLADRGRLAEVERRARDRRDLAGRDQA